VHALDTNVVVRLLTRDDPEQTLRAKAVARRALESGGIWLASVVLVEVVWVLRSSYRLDRTSIVRAIRRLVRLKGVGVEDRDLVTMALAAFESGKADFADYLILEKAREEKALPLWTFDEKLAASEAVELVP
jgi:predicted nucleic-acid-binding protein